MNDGILERVIWVDFKQDPSPIEIEVNEGLSELIREWNEYYLILIQMI